MTELKILFTIAAVVLALMWITLARRAKPMAPAGTLASLHYPLGLRFVALLIALVFPIAFVILLLNVPWQRGSDLLTAASGFGIFAILGGLLLIEVERATLFLTPRGISRYSPWLGRAELAWADITQVTYSQVNQWLVFKGSPRAIRASRFLVNFHQLAHAIHDHLAPIKWHSIAQLVETWRKQSAKSA